VAAERKQIAIIGVCVVIAAAVLAGVVAIAYNGGPNHGSSSSNTHGAVAPRVISA
jgi:flagellar basal body-associated protein FliL